MGRIPSSLSGAKSAFLTVAAVVSVVTATLSKGGDAIADRLHNPTHLSRDAIAIDTRALAAFRIFMGLLLVGDVISRSRNFSFYYTDDGVLSAELTQRLTSDGAFSVFYYTTDPTVMAGIFVATAIAGLVFAAGYQTRVMTIVVFLLAISFDHQNPLVTSYADLLFRLLLFWAIFLPLGERWSIDAVLAASAAEQQSAPPDTRPTAADSVDGDTVDGDSPAQTPSEANAPAPTTPATPATSATPETAGTEPSSTATEWRPRQTVAGLASVAILVQMMAMYVVNGYHKAQSDLWGTTDVAPLVLGIDEMTFLLGDFMRGFPTLLGYGGVLWYYMMLTAWALVLLRGKARMAFIGLFVGGHLSFAITVRIGAFAYVALAGLLLFFPPSFWDTLETIGGQGRRVLSERLSTPLSTSLSLSRARSDLRGAISRLPNPQIRSPAVERGVRVAFTTVLLIAIIAVLIVPAAAYAPIDSDIDGTHETVDATVDALSIDQPAWSVFAPSPRTTDRYYVVAGVTADGEEYDLFNQRELTYDRPYDELQKQHGTYRERFYMNSVRSRGNDDPVSDAFAAHLCGPVAEEMGVDTITHLQMFYATEDITMDTLDDHESRERNFVRFYNGGCGDNPPGDVTLPPS